MAFHIGDQVRFEKDGESFVGTIANIYILPKDYDLADIQTEDELFYAIPTDGISMVE